MNKVLHIVNGTTVMGIMKQASFIGDFIAWDDFLHIGPVPQEFSLQQLSKIRAYFMHEENYSQLNDASSMFEERNRRLETFQDYNKIILWFEQDLYDQLQLLQVLDWFGKHPTKKISLTLVSPYKSFGEYSFQELRNLVLYEKPITDKHLILAQKAWSAFSAPTPIAWFDLLKEPTSVLPFLKGTIKRILEEYPNTKNGLSRTAHQALLEISHNLKDSKDIFISCQKYEEKQFMAESIFNKILDDFTQHKLIIIDPYTRELSITLLGEKVLNGEKNWVEIKNIQHWIGGVNLSRDNLWCWNIQKKTIANYYHSTSLSTLLPVKEKKILNLLCN